MELILRPKTTEVHIYKKISKFHEKITIFSVKLMNPISKLGYTALHMAVKEDNEEHCKVLLENGADPWSMNIIHKN